MDFYDKGFLDIAVERQDTKTQNLALEYLMGYGLDHHSRSINKLMVDLIVLPNFVKYMESRMLSTDVTLSM